MKDDDVRRLFESVDAADTPPPEARDRVRNVIREAWDGLPPASRGGAGIARFAAAAGVVVAAIAAWLVSGPLVAEPPAVAGEVVYAAGGHGVAGNVGMDAPLLAGGATVETTQFGRVLIRLGEGALLRLDADTRLMLASATDIALASGRVFVDTTGSGVRVITPTGVRVRPVGTQFEVAVEDERVVVAVREGRLDLRVADRSIRVASDGGTGEAIVLAGSRLISRERVPAAGPRWDWIHASMPAFELDGATVFDFLGWAAAEAGVALEFANERVAHRAKSVRLHGPVVPAARINRGEIVATLQTAPSFRIAPSEEHRLVVEWASPSD